MFKRWLPVILIVTVVCLLFDLAHKNPPTPPARFVEPRNSSPPDPAKLKKCKALLRDLSRAGLIKSYASDSSGGTAVVGSRFEDAPFDAKRILPGVIVCVETNGSMDLEQVPVIIFQDPRTHHQVATWGPRLGLQVD